MPQALAPDRTATSQPILATMLLAAITPERAAVALFLAATALVLVKIIALTGGHSLYTLDDPYIHLALAERLRLGHYGLNLGEITSPASSILWPFLLIPAAGTPAGPAIPLVLNTLFGAATAYLFGRFAATVPLARDVPATYAQPFRVSLACLLVLACNLVGVAYTGLEHNLQILIATALALALLRYAGGTALPTWALALAAIGPAVRYEMFAVTAAFALVLIYDRRWRAMTGLILASLALPAVLAVFLVANGNYPLPNSVMSKLLLHSAQSAPTSEADFWAMPWAAIASAVRSHWGIDFASKTAVIVSAVITAWSWRTTNGRWRAVSGCAFLAAILHLCVGQFGWWYRYELYALAFAGLIALHAMSRWSSIAVLIGVMLMSHHYLPPVSHTALAAQNIYQQQYQMHRFVAEHYRKPFAVNDVGWVSVGLDPAIPVLDLLGLASTEAMLRKDKSSAWLDAVTRRHHAGLAMVYTSAFRELPASWKKAGEIHLGSPRLTASYSSVAFYATGAGDKAEIVAMLQAFKPSLPPGVVLDIE